MGIRLSVKNPYNKELDKGMIIVANGDGSNLSHYLNGYDKEGRF
jgi:hypothetical protein